MRRNEKPRASWVRPFFTDQDGCVLCGCDVRTCLTNPHKHGDAVRTFRLCWLCHHGYYDRGIVTTSEVAYAEKQWRRGERPDFAAFHARIAADLRAGRRKQTRCFNDSKTPDNRKRVRYTPS